jgi:hypothetical protein
VKYERCISNLKRKQQRIFSSSVINQYFKLLKHHQVLKYHLKAIILPYFRIININQSSQTDFERITFYDGDDSIEQAGDKNSNVRNRFSIFVKR